MITYKVCRRCSKVFNNLRSNRGHLGKKQTEGMVFCSRECTGLSNKKPITVYKDEVSCFFVLNDKKFRFSERHIDKVIFHSWYEGVLGYAESRINNKIKRLHSVIFGVNKVLKVDHINRDKTDNRDENLRFVTHRENILNSVIGDKMKK